MISNSDISTIIFTTVSIFIGFVVAYYLSFAKKTKSSVLNSSTSSDKMSDISRGLKREEYGNNANAKSNGTNDDKVLSPSQFRSFPVLKVTKVSHNTRLIRFEIHPEKTLGLTIGRHITVRAEIDGNKVMRAYTPTSKTDQKGYFELLIKSYEFGKLSPYMNSLKVGQLVEIRGPVGRFQYTINQYHTIGLVAGGTGITPCLQFIRSILCCPEYRMDSSKLILFYQNRTEEDILLSDELQELMKKYSNRLQIFYFLSNPSTPATNPNFGKSSENEIRGYINQEYVQRYLHIDLCQYVCICGPSGFNETIQGLLASVGHTTEKSVFVW